ncbi:MAG: glycosyltransferase family 4 protein [Nanoarchaeota archaeon]
MSFPIYFARKVIFTSEDLEEMGKIKFRNSKSKINFVPLIIDEKLFVPQDKIKMKKELGLPLDKPIILYVGRISYLKGSDILFELAQQNKDKIFLVIGEIFDEIIGKNPSDNLILAKQQKMNLLIKYYSAADLFIFPSRIEAYGLSPREAMLCETPSLVSDITALGLTEYALKSKPEILDMQKQIDIFFSMSQKERNKLRKISRESVVKTNSFENLKDKWESILLD